MPLNLSNITHLINGSESKGEVIDLIVEYDTLKKRIDDAENQSTYFRQGIESHRNRLVAIDKQFEEIRGVFNASDVEGFEDKISQNKEFEAEYRKTGMSTVRLIHMSHIAEENQFLNGLIHLKSLTETLMPLGHYLENPEAFLKILD